VPLVADPTVLSAPVARLAEAVAGLSVVEPAALVEAAALEACARWSRCASRSTPIW